MMFCVAGVAAIRETTADAIAPEPADDAPLIRLTLAGTFAIKFAFSPFKSFST